QDFRSGRDASTSAAVGLRTSMTLERREPLLHALEAGVDLALLGRIGDADVLACPEGLAGHGDDATLAKQSAGHVGGGLNAAATEAFGDVGIDVERTVRLVALDPGDLAQASDDAVAQRDVLRAHVVDAFLTAGERRDAGLLHDGGWVRSGLALQFLDGRRDGRGGKRVAESPAG